MPEKRPDTPRELFSGPESGPEAPFPIKLQGPIIKGFGRGSREVSFKKIKRLKILHFAFYRNDGMAKNIDGRDLPSPSPSPSPGRVRVMKWEWVALDGCCTLSEYPSN